MGAEVNLQSHTCFLAADVMPPYKSTIWLVESTALVHAGCDDVALVSWLEQWGPAYNKPPCPGRMQVILGFMTGQSI
jgi:hypothetical protein